MIVFMYGSLNITCTRTMIPQSHLQTPIAPQTADSHFEQDATIANAPWLKPVGRTLLDIAATYRSTIDTKLLEFDVCVILFFVYIHIVHVTVSFNAMQEIGFEASEHGLSNHNISNLFAELKDSQPATTTCSATTQKRALRTKTGICNQQDTGSPTCILVQLSELQSELPRLQSKSSPKCTCENIPDDILTNLHMHTDSHNQLIRGQQAR